MNGPAATSLQPTAQTCRSTGASIPGPAPSDVTRTRTVVAVVLVVAWLANDAQDIDTAALTPHETASRIAAAASRDTAQQPSATVR
jgi:hypothetical protein